MATKPRPTIAWIQSPINGAWCPIRKGKNEKYPYFYACPVQGTVWCQSEAAQDWLLENGVNWGDKASEGPPQDSDAPEEIPEAPEGATNEPQEDIEAAEVTPPPDIPEESPEPAQEKRPWLSFF